MKILSVHTSYQLPGGEDQVFALEAELLRAHGHQVARYTASNDRLKGQNPLVMLGNTIWNGSARRAIAERLRWEGPDLMHVHNTFPLLSPSIYYAARRSGIPVVQTLHNYRLLCPAATLFRDGGKCEDCLGRRIPWPGVAHACYRGSRAASSGAAAMLAVHNLIHTWTRTVSVYIALSNFAKEKFIQGGLPAEKIFVKPNFLASDAGLGSGAGNFALFVGRLTPEKGIEVMLEAWRKLRGSGLPLQIAGDGPLAGRVEQASRELPEIVWLKWLPRAEILVKMRQASFLVLPSTWYEGFPMILAEAFSAGLPVIASDLGSMTSIVGGGGGLLFKPGDPDSLAERVRSFLADPAAAQRMRAEARREFEEKYTGERNYARIMEIYGAALAG